MISVRCKICSKHITDDAADLKHTVLSAELLLQEHLFEQDLVKISRAAWHRHHQTYMVIMRPRSPSGCIEAQCTDFILVSGSSPEASHANMRAGLVNAEVYICWVLVFAIDLADGLCLALDGHQDWTSAASVAGGSRQQHPFIVGLLPGCSLPRSANQTIHLAKVFIHHIGMDIHTATILQVEMVLQATVLQATQNLTSAGWWTTCRSSDLDLASSWYSMKQHRESISSYMAKST